MTTFPVELAVYDLSRGMARQLSMQFLGPQYAIDIIPHTAILVYGREYFFGGGIQHEDPNQFRLMRGIHPVQIISLGRTSVSRDDFHAWCQNCNDSGKYTAASYNLLTRNCNNFSNDAAIGGLKLPQGVPDWILDVPRRFLSSPMGQMVRPMLESMQMRQGTGGGSFAPFSEVPTNTFSTTPNMPEEPPSNPWANISEANPTTEVIDDDQKQKPKAMEMNNLPVLNSFRKPLVSTEYKTVSLCVKKISTILEDEAEREALQTLERTLIDSNKLDEEEVEQFSRIILTRVLKASKSTVITYALMLLRVIVLEYNGVGEAVQECLVWIEEHLANSDCPSSCDSLLLASHTARSMAWLTLANAASLQWRYDLSEKLLDAVFTDWASDSQPRVEVRQAVAAFSYNYVLQVSSSKPTEEYELTDDHVSLLCGTLESLVEETDATTQLRRLLVAARILVPKDSKVYASSVRALMLDLGFQDVIQDLQRSSTAMTGNMSDAMKCKDLAGEVLELLMS